VLRRIEASSLDEVVVTNSIAHAWDPAISKKVKQLSIGRMLADVISTVHNQASVQSLLETCKWTHAS
jgi:phosphoribosylpyrophosphate synthetase